MIKKPLIQTNKCNIQEIKNRFVLIQSIKIDPNDEFVLTKFKKSLCHTLLDSIAKCAVPSKKIKDREKFKMLIKYSGWEYADIVSLPHSYEYFCKEKSSNKDLKLFCEKTIKGIEIWNIEQDIKHGDLVLKNFPNDLEKFKSYSNLIYDDRNCLIHEHENLGSLPTIKDDPFQYMIMIKEKTATHTLQQFSVNLF